MDRAAPTLALKDPGLLRSQAYVNGHWIDALDGKILEILNPANGQLVGTVPLMGATETRAAIDAARDAWPAWRAKTAKDRAALLRRWFDAMIEHADDLALITTIRRSLAGVGMVSP
jgi:succinate-semialdehyde dehydrogenase/glutarate-semialdehyde dehydrogenase